MVKDWFQRGVEKWRMIRSNYLGKMLRPLATMGIKPNHLTLLSFFSGILAVWFLFSNTTYFIIFAIGQLLFDVFDGILARETKTTRFGKYADVINDNLITILILAKAALYTGNMIIITTTALYTIHQIIYIASKLRAPVLWARTPLFLFYFFNFYISGAIFVLAVTAYGLALQFHHFTFFKPR
jgi:phosphatidylglycerophosphate synthase